VLDIPSATVAIAWSPDNQFIAEGNLDNTLSVIEWGNPAPWVMRGFPGKVRQLAWYEVATNIGEPMLASCSGAGDRLSTKFTSASIGSSGRLGCTLAAGYPIDASLDRCIQWLLLPHLASPRTSTCCWWTGW